MRNFGDGGPAADYKFFMHGGMITAIDVISNRSNPKRKCQTWFDASGERRIDQRGCVFRAGRNGCGAPTCSPAYLGQPPVCEARPPPLPPGVRARLHDIAIQLGRAIGIPTRVDLYVRPDGTPVFGEWTFRHTGGAYHCAVPTLSNGGADPCYLGRLWNMSGVPNLGAALPPPPPIVKRILGPRLEAEAGRMRYVPELQKCALARQYLG